MAEKNGNNASFLTWANVVSTGMFLIVVATSFWTIMQDKFLVAEKRDIEVRAELLRIQSETRTELTRLDVRRSEFVGQPEFKQFIARIDLLNARLLILDQTRPTTGELQAVSRTVENNLSDLSLRVRTLESTTPRIANPAIK